MDTTNQSAGRSGVMGWTGRVLTTLLVLLFCVGGALGAIKPASMRQQMDEGMTKMGWTSDLTVPLAVVEIVCGILYAIPQTSVFGAILLTGYLGGATATHIRIHDPMAVFPIVVGILVWLGIYLREPRLRAIAFWR